MINELKADMNLDPELLAAYIDQRLSPEQRAAVEVELARDPDAYSVLVETVKAQEAFGLAPVAEAEMAAPPVSPKGRMRRWTIAAGALAAAATLVLVVRTRPALMERIRGERVDARFERLVTAVGEERNIEARLTGGFKFGPLSSINRGPGDLSRRNLGLLAVAGDLQKRAEAEPTAENLVALGAALIQLGDIDGGIAQLEKANQLRSSNETLSNLAAAYLTRAERTGRDADLGLALETVDRAVAISPALPEALYNRALILEKFRLTDSAVKAWDAYLQADERSPWAEEARRRRASLLAQSRGPTVAEAAQTVAREPALACDLVSRDSLLMREAVDDVLLPEWADGFLLGQPQAADRLATARAIAGCFATQGRGELTSQTVATIDRAGPAGRADLARAHQLWRTGRGAYARSAPDEFAPAFASARETFERHASPLSLWTRQYAIAAMFYRGQLAEAVAGVTALEADPGVIEGGALWARLQWIRASIHFQQAAFGQSLVEYRRALTAFDALHEGEHSVAMHQSIAEAYGRLGLEREAWQEHRRALEGVDLARDYRRIHSALTSPGYTANLAGMPAAAHDFFNEGRTRAVTAGNVNYQFECEVGMGRALMALGRFADAETIYQSALILSKQVSNPSLRARHTSDIYNGLSEIAASNRDYSTSLKRVDEALTAIGTVSSEYLVANFHLRRGRTLAQMGDLAAAKGSFAAGVDVLESKRALLQQTAQRVAYTDRVFELYSEMIGLIAVDLKQPEEALAWADRSRARSIQDHRPIPAFDTLRRAGVPRGSGVLVLASTDRGLLAWLLTNTSVAFHATPDSTLVSRFQSAASRPSTQLLEDGYREIVQPFADELASVDRVTIVPDWSTQAIPYSALNTGTHAWITRTAVDLAPSVSIALAALTADTTGPPPTSVAIVTADYTNPKDGTALSGATTEAREIASLYKDVLTLHGRGATIQSLRSAMGKVDVMHVGMHARSDARYLDRLTIDIPDAETGLPLSAESVLGTGRAPRLVVLAACQTANGPLVRGEILMSLARPFLLAGSRHVVATLWDVPDRETNQLMTAFHAGLTAGASPAIALATAQRKAALDGGDPWWGAFVVVTAGSPALGA